MPDNLPEGLFRALLLPLIAELLPVADNDNDIAWEAAEAAAMSFNPQTANELRLAVRIALHNILGNRLTAEAKAPGLTPAGSIRMHRCALAYIREADKAERRLEQLQAARMQEDNQKPKPESAPASAPNVAQAEPASPSVKEKPSQPRPSIPAYKLLKQERRLAKQQARDTRQKTQAQTQGRAADLPLAA